MSGKVIRSIALSIAALAVVASVVVIAEEFFPAGKNQRTEEFQRLVRGLGLGPALDLSQCPFCFDPRLGFVCQQQSGPIPGGYYFCPHHACSVLYYPPLGHPGQETGKEDRGVEIR